MAFNEELDILLKDLTDEANNFKEAKSSEEEKEALKDMLDIFMRGTQSIREHIDRYNERRWNRQEALINLNIKRPPSILVCAEWQFLLMGNIIHLQGPARIHMRFP